MSMGSTNDLLLTSGATDTKNIEFKAPGPGILILIDVRAVATATMVVKLQYKDKLGNLLDVPSVVTASIAAAGIKTLTVYPGVTAAANVAVNMAVGGMFNLNCQVTLGGGTILYDAYAILLP